MRNGARSALAAHFGAPTVGRSLCESATWLNCKEINDRFRDLLSEPFSPGTFQLFPKKPSLELERFDTLSILWQLRHSVVHNVGIITHSDAIKLSLIAKEPVGASRALTPTRDDLRYVKRFLDETAERSNKRIGERLAELLSNIHAENPTLFDAREMAGRVTRIFGLVLTVDNVSGSLPLP